MSIRSLLSGVSGLRNFQFQLDVVGNNIANSQTPGYKSSRVTFQDLLTQTIAGATAPATDGSSGGTNPQEVGLGSTVGAIDTDLTQGNILNTGRLTDLAIQGEGFYKLSDGTNIYYSRAGAFDIDADGYLVSTTTGYIVQGYNATAGVLSSSVANIQLPVGVVLPAQETTTVSLVGNLDSSSDQIGSILQASQILAIEEAGDDNDISGLYANGDLNGRIAGMQSGTSTVTITDGSSNSETYTYTTGTVSGNYFNSLDDLAAAITTDFGAAGYNTLSASVTTAGALRLTDLTGAVQTVTVTSNNSSLNTAFTDLNANIAGGGNVDSDEFSHTATGADDLVDLRNSSGTSLGLTAGNTINISADIGGTTTTGSQAITGATVSNLLSTIQTSLDLQSATISNGQITITGKGGTNYEVTNMSLTDSGGSATFDAVFDDTSGNWTEIQEAADNYSTSFVAYDDNGAQHTVTIKFNIREPVGGLAQWVYDIESVETSSGTSETVSGDSSGTITFNGDGSLGLTTNLSPTIATTGIGSNISLSINLGTSDEHDGLVSFENANSARFAEITGYASGELQTITINTEGIVTGNFTNGQNQTLAQIILTVFDNPSGLSKEGNNLFSATVNSGVGSDGAPSVGGRGSLIPSALEGSNVDLAQEFINLITAQRGFQTNARVITTANTILGELVSIVR